MEPIPLNRASVRAWLALRGMTQADLAGRMKRLRGRRRRPSCDAGSISNWLYGRPAPAEAAEMIASILEVPIEALTRQPLGLTYAEDLEEVV